MANNVVVAIVGLAGSGKSASLSAIKNQKAWLYLNCDVNKPLPFAHNFNEKVITKYSQIGKLIQAGNANAACKGIIIDTYTSALDMSEMSNKKTAEDKFAVWDGYRDNILNLFLGPVAEATKPIIFICHVEMTKDIRGRPKLAIAVKGATANRGIENFFTNIVYADFVELHELEDYKNDMLTITKDEELDEGKYVFQTRKNASGQGTNIRQTRDMWTRDKTFIDNNIMYVIDTITAKYNEKVK